MGYIKQAFWGLSWWGGFRILSRIVTFGKIALLARILTPTQFGLFGIASLSLASFEIFSETGINVFLLQEKKIAQYLDTAWIISILRGLLIAILTFLAAPVITSFFNSPEANTMIKLISLVPLIKGFINPHLIIYQKKLEFRKDIYFKSIIFILSTLATIIIALLTASPQSLVWGLIISALIEVLFSHKFIHPRPKFAFKKFQAKKIIHRGKWITLTGIFNHCFHQGDDFIVSKVLGSSSLGIYQLAYKISTLPITEVADIFGRISFPIYTQIQQDRQRLKKAYLKTTLSIATLVIPFSLILFFFAQPLVLILLGPKWIEATAVLRVLAIFGALRSILGSSSSVLLALKKQQTLTYITVISLVAMLLSIMPLGNQFGLVGVAWATIIGALAPLPLIGTTLFKEFRK